MRLLPLVGLVGSIVGLAVAMTGEAAERKSAPPEHAVAHAVDVRPTGTIPLEVGKGTLIRLGRSAATVFVANPDIADVQVKSPMLIYVSAKSPGQTVIYAVDKDDNVLLSEAIRVEYDVAQLNRSFAQLLPGARIAARTIEDKLVLSGIVANANDAQKACALALSVVGEGGPPPGAIAAAGGGGGGGGGGGAAAGGGGSLPKASPTGGPPTAGQTQACTAGGRSEPNSRVINQLVVATPSQVNLRVRIAEVKKDVLKQLGINLSKCVLGSGLGSCSLAFQTANPVTGPTDVIGTAVQNTLQIGRTGTGAQSVSGTLDALAQEGLATTLAEPNLTALNGQTASFLVGGTIEIPTSISVTGGVPTISVAPEPFGVRLDFTPTIIDANHISLKLRPEVSSLNFANSTSIGAGITVPGKDETVAETTVELGSGESFALAGLLQHNTTQNLSKIPGIGDVPILGALFRSNQFQHNETELVIIVTPYLVRPVATALTTPVDGFSEAHDAEQVISGDNYRQKLPAPARGPLDAGGRGLIGPVGFRLD